MTCQAGCRGPTGYLRKDIPPATTPQQWPTLYPLPVHLSPFVSVITRKKEQFTLSLSTDATHAILTLLKAHISQMSLSLTSSICLLQNHCSFSPEESK